jgi:hypothetical protein
VPAGGGDALTFVLEPESQCYRAHPTGEGRRLAKPTTETTICAGELLAVTTVDRVPPSGATPRPGILNAGD